MNETDIQAAVDDMLAELMQEGIAGSGDYIETKVMEELRKSNQRDSEEESRRMKAKLSESVRRLSELDALVSKLYEDWIAGRINETNFTRMTE